MIYQATALSMVLAAAACTQASAFNGQSGSFRHQLAFSSHGGREVPHVAHGQVPFSMRALLEADEIGVEIGTENLADSPVGIVDDDDAGGEDDDVRIAPPSVGADVPVTYFGPAPSQVDRRLIGPFQLLKSGVLDENAGTITLPLYRGVVEQPEGGSGVTGDMFYVVTDTTDEAIAAALGLNHSPKLIYANVGRGARKATLDQDLVVHFQGGAVDFSPELSITPGEDSPFPPTAATAGSVGDELYSPYFVLENSGGNVYNGPIISMGATIPELQEYCNGIPPEKEEAARKVLHDGVVSICPADDGLGGTVTLTLSPGFSFARPVFYLSLDASEETPAALESSTLAPGMQDIRVGVDDTLFSAVERIFITINGHTNADINSEGLADGPGETSHPSRQGLNSALMGDGSPLNVLGGIPTIATDYSPAWDANLGEWTEYAIANGYRDRLLEEFQILGYVQRGFLTGPGGAPYGSASSNFIVNCPIVFRFL